MRVTPQRQRVAAAVTALGHATPEAVATRVDADGGGPLPLSTVYRALDALEAVGVVSHTHLDHGPPTYHLADRADHLHLVCTACGSVCETGLAAADALVGNLRETLGFDADVRHMAIHGRCASCSTT